VITAVLVDLYILLLNLVLEYSRSSRDREPWPESATCTKFSTEALKLQGCFLFIKVERYWYNGVPSPSLARPCILQLYFESGNMLPDSKYSCNIQGRAKLGLGTPLYQYRSTFINKKQPCNFRASVLNLVHVALSGHGSRSREERLYSSTKFSSSMYRSTSTAVITAV
jgi:hypothetical protein